MTTVLLRTAVENLLQNGRRTLAERTAEPAHLTEREVDVLRLMANGESNKVIAATLDISVDTAKKHVRNAIDKSRHLAAPMRLLSRPRQVSWAILSLLLLKANLSLG